MSIRTLAVLAFATLPVSAFAQEVILRSPDGSLELSGELVAFDGQKYVLRTLLGDLNVDALRVDCFGEGCPSIDNDTQQIRLALEGDEFAGFARVMADALAREISANVVEIDDTFLLRTDDGRAVVSFTAATQLANPANDLLNGSVDIYIGKTNFAQQTLTDFGLNSSVIALDGVGFFTYQGLPVRSLSERELADVFSGKVQNWAELGFSDAPINAFATGGDLNAFSDVADTATDSVTQVANVFDLASVLDSDPSAIAAVSLSKLDGLSPTRLEGTCGILSVPSDFALRTSEYPYVQNVYAVYRNESNSPEVARLIETLVDPAFQALINEQTSFVGLTGAAQPADQQGLRFQSALLSDDTEITLEDVRTTFKQLQNADRLPISLRFESGSANLDQRGQEDLARLVDLFGRGQLANQTIILMGFTDAIGAANANRLLAEQRADAVANLLRASSHEGSLDTVSIVAVGAGEVSPILCNDTDYGRTLNRRVEVWVRERHGDLQ